MHLNFVSAPNMFRYIIFYFIIVNVKANLNSTIIQISSGLIEGEYVESEIINKSYYAFRGIPYAEPPLGKLRFQPAIKPKPWTKTLQTKTDGLHCMQVTGGSEDCLFLNVYTPSLPASEENNELLPVMVFIHGGAFVIGSSDSNKYGPDYLVDKNIVLVTINYRLNIFGFLNAMDDSAPGNVGLKDQVLALKWVQENIDKFHGNKEQVTIFGHSAGSASVQYLLQSKLAKGLFHKAIMQSGSTLNNWAFENDPTDLIHKFGKVLNISTENITEFIHELQKLSSEDLFIASLDKSLVDSKHRLISPRFIPSLEKNSPNAFMTESSYSILEKNEINSVPTLIGYVSNEALFFLDIKYININITFDVYENDPSLLVPKALNIINNSDKSEKVLNEIKKHYFEGVSITNKTAFVNFKSDEIFVRGIRKSIEFLRKSNDLYFYIFDYKNKNDTSEYSGVPHIGELKFLFYTGVQESDEDKMIREKMTTLWTNFAKTGSPTPEENSLLDNVKWPLVSKSEADKLQYLHIGQTLEIRENPGQNNFEFFENIFQKYGETPFFIY